MYSEPYELTHTGDGVTARINARGAAVLASPTINRGTAFTEQERRPLSLTGLLPTGVSTIEGRCGAPTLSSARSCRGAFGHPGRRWPDARPADRDPRRGHRRVGYRRHDPGRDGR
jgi:hypothetical protein